MKHPSKSSFSPCKSVRFLPTLFGFIVFFFFFFGSALGHGPIKAIIFDCDGTLVDNGIGYFLDWQYALSCHGYELDEEDFWNFMTEHQLIGAPEADKVILQYCCGFLSPDCPDQILKDKNAFSKQLHKTYEFPPIETTVHFLHALAKEKERLGIKLGVASGSSKEHILRVIQRLGIEHYFDVVISGSDDLSDYEDPEGVNKPKPYVYLHAAKLLGLNPEECIAIEDSPTGIYSAVTAGYTTVAIPNRFTAHQDLSLSHIILQSLNGVTPEEFLEFVVKNQIQKYDTSLSDP